MIAVGKLRCVAVHHLAMKAVTGDGKDKLRLAIAKGILLIICCLTPHVPCNVGAHTKLRLRASGLFLSFVRWATRFRHHTARQSMLAGGMRHSLFLMDRRA
jgi:hypothetical protein